MGCHRDEIRAAEVPCPVCILALLRHTEDARGTIVISGDRPGDGQLEVCYRTGDQPFAHLFYGRAEILLGLVHDGFSLALADLRGIGQDDHTCEMERAWPRSRQSRDELCCRGKRRLCSCRTVERNECTQGGPSAWGGVPTSAGPSSRSSSTGTGA